MEKGEATFAEERTGQVKRGRPKLEDGQGRDAVITVRLSDEERKILGAAAEQAGKKLSDWMRDTIRDTINPPAPTPATKPPVPVTITVWKHEGIFVEVSTPMPYPLWLKLKRYVTEVLEPPDAPT